MYSWKSHFSVLADYQHWANEVLFNSLDRLQTDVISSDQGLFFKSIHHTVDHLLLVSQVWLARLQGENLEANYRVIHHPDFRELKQSLRRETRKLQSWLDARTDDFFEAEINFVGSDGKTRQMWAREALTHLFTHYTHHRGQISAVITRVGGPSPEMDYVFYRREMDKVLKEVQQ
jgi:uncharacterized damage-inducible protein DinB